MAVVDELSDAPAASVVAPADAADAPSVEQVTTAPVQKAAAAESVSTVASAGMLRRGLPRVAGAAPWPGEVAAPAFYPERKAAAPVPAAASSTSTQSSPATPTPQRAPRAPRAAQAEVAPREQKRYGRYTLKQWVGVSAVLAIVLGAVAAIAVLAARWALTLEPVADFVQTYSGEYHLPEAAPVGIPAWLAWQHFFNAFFMLLIIRSGWGVRTQKKPPAYWTPRNRPETKVSLTVWFHQSLDVLWLVNGALFIVLLLVTGQWMRVVPTSLEVFPNALSALLQYVSLDWPTENGWVNYNSLQQLTYFTTIFIAAPLAAITGFRMSTLWPARAEKLTRAYPIKWARAVHFPVMLYFVVFIVVHVALVLSTGALRNLNHMYAAQGSVDPDAFADNWTGFWMFVLSLAVFVAAWVAARPIVLAPIARLFGSVSAR